MREGIRQGRRSFASNYSALDHVGAQLDESYFTTRVFGTLRRISAAAGYGRLRTTEAAPAPPPPRPNVQQRPAPLAKRPNPPTRQMLDLPPLWIERVQDMPPAQQERFLANNERFRSLPPQRQDQIRKRLQAWNNLTPDQRQALIERQLVWEQMTPAQQRYVRQTLLPQWQGMPPARRQIVLKKLRDLRDLDDSQRSANSTIRLLSAGSAPTSSICCGTSRPCAFPARGSYPGAGM